MTIISTKQFLTRENRDRILLGMKVCIHVLKSAKADVRGMRTATTLAEAGCIVSFIDIAGDSTQNTEERIGNINVKHITVPDAFFTTRFNHWAFFWSALMLIRGIIRLLQTPADVYHALDLPALPACYIAAKLRRKPVIFEAYELPLDTLPASEKSMSRRWLDALLAPILRVIVPRCAGVITVSPPMEDEFRKRYHHSNVSLVRNILAYQVIPKSDLLRQRLDLSPGTRIALYQGNLQAGRGLERLVQAAAFLEPNIVIVLMGDDMLGTQAQLEVLIESEGVSDRVKIIPPVPYTQLLAWTASADIGLITYMPDYALNIRMCLPNKLFEYLMAGLPVLTSQLDPVAEVIRSYDVGQILPSLTPSDIGAAINTMLTDSIALTRMHQNALDVAQYELNWEKESSKLIRLYQDIQLKFKRRFMRSRLANREVVEVDSVNL